MTTTDKSTQDQQTGKSMPNKPNNNSNQTKHQTFLQDGVRLSWILVDFIAKCGGREALQGLATKEVHEKFIQPETNEKLISYAEMLRQKQEKGKKGMIDKPNVVVSHIYSYQFLNTIDALEKHHENEKDEVVVWWDLFSMNPHEEYDWDSEWLTTSLKQEIGTIGRVVMVMSPWNDPLPYRDAWCVFVVFCAFTSEQSVFLEIALSAKDREQFIADFDSVRDETAVKKMLSEMRKDRIDSNNEDDKEKLLTAIGGQIAIGELEQMLFDHFRSWVISSLLLHLNANTRKYGRMAPETLLTVFSLALLYKNYGNMQYVEVLHLPLEKRQQKKRDPDSMDTLKSMVNLAVIHAEQGRIEDADALYREAFRKVKDTEGNDEILVVIMNNMGLLFEKQEMYDQAEKLFAECYKNRLKLLGHDHQDTLRSMHLLADVHRKQGEYKKARTLGFECNERQLSNLGESHPDTVQSFALLDAIRHEVST